MTTTMPGMRNRAPITSRAICHHFILSGRVRTHGWLKTNVLKISQNAIRKIHISFCFPYQLEPIGHTFIYIHIHGEPEYEVMSTVRSHLSKHVGTREYSDNRDIQTAVL